MNRNNDSIENAIYNLAEKLNVEVPANLDIAGRINHLAENYTPPQGGGIPCATIIVDCEETGAMVSYDIVGNINDVINAFIEKENFILLCRVYNYKGSGSGSSALSNFNAYFEGVKIIPEEEDEEDHGNIYGFTIKSESNTSAKSMRFMLAYDDMDGSVTFRQMSD